MVYEKYTKKNGKLYGPYLYENKRVGNKIVTTYMGIPSKKRNYSVLFYAGIFLVSALMLGFALYWFLGSPTPAGKVFLNVEGNYLPGEIINGNLKLDLKQGEMIPADSVVRLSLGEQVREIKLRDLVSENIVSGNFYAEGSELSGEGEGYGVAGTAIIYPEVDFEIRIVQTDGTDQEGAEEPSGNESSGEEQNETGEDGESDEGEDSSQPPEEEENPPAGESLITGSVVLEEDEIVHGTVRAGEDFTYVLEEGQDAEVVSGSVNVDGNEVPDDVVSVFVSETVRVSTNYSEEREGFGPEYGGDEVLSLNIDLSEFDMNATTDVLTVRVIYENETIIESEENISVRGNESESNESFGSNESSPSNESGVTGGVNFTQNIPVVRIIKNNYTELNMGDYFEGAARYEFFAANITGEFEGDVLRLVPDEDFSGAEKGIVRGCVDEYCVSSNEFTILVSAGALNIKTIRNKIEVGKPVRWEKNVSLEVPETVTIELPAEAKNISVRKITEEGEEDASLTSITGNVIANVELKREARILRWWKGVVKTITGRAVDEADSDGENIQVTLSDDATQYKIEYYTPAPEKMERDTGMGKEVIISAPEGLGYTDVIAFTELDNSLGAKIGKIKVYWRNYDAPNFAEIKEVKEVEDVTVVDEIIADSQSSDNETNTSAYVLQEIPFDQYDLDGDGNIDYLEWVVPHLSDQIYEIVIEIVGAEHLDGERAFISDIYESVRELDGNWSETIPDGHYVRVVFRENLTSENDITIYPRVVDGAPRIEVYELNENETIATFEEIVDDSLNKVYLTNLEGTQDTFDLRVVGGDVEFDYIVDPTYVSNVSVFGFDAFELGSAIVPDSPFNSTMSAATPSAMTKLASADDSRWQTLIATKEGWHNSQVYIFNLSSQITNRSLVTLLNITWAGYGENVSGYYTNISFWNWTSGAWYKVLNYTTKKQQKNDLFDVGPLMGIKDFINSTSNQVAVMLSNRRSEKYRYVEGEYVAARCSGNWWGTHPCFYTYDSDWVTFGAGGGGSQTRSDGTGVVELSFTRPDGASLNGNLWQIKDGLGMTNLTIPASCVIHIGNDVEPRRVTLVVTSTFTTGKAPADNTVWACKNNTGTFALRSTGNGANRSYVYDMEIYWNQSIDMPLSTDYIALRVNTPEDIVSPYVNFTSPTPANGTSQSSNSIYVNVSSSDTNSHYTFVDADRRNILWMRMDDVNSSGDPIDLSTWSNNGSKYGNAVQTSSGAFGKGFAFDGTSASKIIVRNSSSVLSFNASRNYTWSVWVKPRSYIYPAGGILQKCIPTYGSNIKGYTVYLRGDGVIMFGDCDSLATGVSSSATAPLNQWTHIAINYSNKAFTFFVNGEPAGSGAIGSFGSENQFNLTIGAAIDSDNGNSLYFNGTIDEVMIFNTVLSTQEIRALYDAGTKQYYNNFTNLGGGMHNFTAYSVDIAGNKNQSEQRSITVTTENLTDCGLLDVANRRYNLMNNVIASTNCFTVGANNVSVNLRGFNITGTGADGYAAFSINGYNKTTIINGTIMGFVSYGIRSINAWNGTFANFSINTFSAGTLNYGVYVSGGGYNKFLQLNVSNLASPESTTSYGLYLTSTSHNILSKIAANKIGNNPAAFGAFVGGNNNSIYDSTFNSNTGPSGGIWVGLYFSASNSTVTNVTANFNDGPSPNPTSSGITVTGSSNVFSNITALGNDNYALYLFGAVNNTFENCTVTGTGMNGIYLSSAQANRINNFKVDGSMFGLNISSSPNNVFSNGTIMSPIEGVHLIGASANNTFVNITMTGVYGMGYYIRIYSAINGTTFVDMPETGRYSFRNGTVTVRKTSMGEIKFLQAVSGTGESFSNDIVIDNNRMEVNSSQKGLNKSANVTLYGAPTEGIISYAILRNGVVCPSTVCYNFTALNASPVVFNVTAWTSYKIGERLSYCLESSCAENSACYVNADCILFSAGCSNSQCDFTNMTINATVYSGYTAGLDGRDLRINITSNLSRSLLNFLTNGAIDVSGGRSSNSPGDGGRLDIIVPDLLNTTNAKLLAKGGDYLGAFGAGGEGGVIQLNFHGLIRNFTSAGSQINVSGGSGSLVPHNGEISYIKDMTCPLDVDIDNDGYITGSGDVLKIKSTYSNITSDPTFNINYDITCDGKIDIRDLARVGFEFGTR